MSSKVRWREPEREETAGIEGERMTELDKLEAYLKDRNIPYKRIDEKPPIPFSHSPFEIFEGIRDRHQIIVFDDKGNCLWDAICQWESYGYKQGLLEIMGSLVNKKKDGDVVVGWLTAEDVIKRIEENEICKGHTPEAPA